MTELGLTIFSGGRGPERFERASALAREAEAAGFDTVWTGELYNRSATVPMAMLAAATDRVRIGSNIAYGAGRSPLIWAAEARDLDELSGGRLILGLGNGTRGMLENWLGVSGEAPAARMAELVEVLRKLWRLHEGPVHHEGRFYRVHLAPTADTPAPFQEHLPIWTAGVNPGMIRVAARVADGLVAHPMTTSAYLAEVVRPELSAARSGFVVKGIRMCAVDDDETAARRRIAYAIGQYAPSHVYDRLFALHGWSGHQQRIRLAAKEGNPAAMTDAVPEEAIDQIGIACRPDQLAERVARHAADFDHLNLVAPVWGLSGDEAEDATRRILTVAMAHR
jgi:alkanesulfonate monooxygenase SsuD/methylene tetrahydromethanopterin reductase-like flavin-dependent oxidoreductase (luciferase family)